MRYGLDEAKKQLLGKLDQMMTDHAPPASFPVVVRLKAPLIDMDPLLWLVGQKTSRKIFWHSAEKGLSIAGIGAVFEASAEGWYGLDEVWGRAQECVNACADIRLFTGMSFARNVTGVEWKGFPGIKFILPAVEIIKDKEGCWLVVNAVRGRDGEPFSPSSRRALENMFFFEPAGKRDIPVVSFENTPDYEDWVCSAEAVLESLDKEDVEKVVLARRISFELSAEVFPELVLKALMTKRPADGAFMAVIDENAFFSISSDPVYRREGSRVYSSALAGRCPSENEKPGNAGPKESRLVATALIEVFREFCRSYQVDCQQGGRSRPQGVSSAPELMVRLSGVLAEGATDKDFLQAIHPVPAACGVPAEKARLLLQQYEVFDRGWFAAPAGFIGQKAVELALTQQACLIETGYLHTYATTAFVKGADPFVQWEEASRQMEQIFKEVGQV